MIWVYFITVDAKYKTKIEMNDIDSSAISIARKHLCSLFASILFIQYPNSAIHFHLPTELLES